MRSVVARYWDRADSSDRLRESEFGALVFRWLQSLTHSIDGAYDEAERSLVEVGLLDAIRGGAVTNQAAA